MGIYSETAQRVAEFTAEIEAENPQWVKERRLCYLYNQWADLRIEIEEAQKECQRMQGSPEQGLALLRAKENIEIWQKEIKAIKWEIRYLKTGRPSRGVTPEMIEQAKQKDLGELIEVGRNGFARCISGKHEDRHPSLCCKNNWAYCFSCGWHGSVIDVARIVWNCGFVEAVRRLNHG